jgi:hypothetical protein
MINLLTELFRKIKLCPNWMIVTIFIYRILQSYISTINMIQSFHIYDHLNKKYPNAKESSKCRSLCMTGYNPVSFTPIRALSAQSAAEFNISPGRWQHLWLVAIVPPMRWGKMDRNDCHTAWVNFKTLISSLYHYKNYA